MSSTQVSNRTFLIVSTTITSIAGICVIARLIADWQRKRKRHIDHIDDYITVLALMFLVASVAGFNELILALSNPTTTLDHLMRLSHALNWLGVLMLWGCKVPILLLYVTLFGIKTWLKVASYAIIVVTGTMFLIDASIVTAKCSGNADEALLMRCETVTSRAGFTMGIVSVLTDVLIFVLPISIIANLHLPIQKKIGLVFVFAGGLVAIAASVVSTYYKWRSLKWSSSGGTNDMICTIVECATAIIVACVPGVYALWCHSIAKTGIYLRLSSAFSQIRLSRSRRPRSGSSDASIKSSSNTSTKVPSENFIKSSFAPSIRSSEFLPSVRSMESLRVTLKEYESTTPMVEKRNV